MRKETIEKALARWKPTKDNNICCCAGETICAYHELTGIIECLAALPHLRAGREEIARVFMNVELQFYSEGGKSRIHPSDAYQLAGAILSLLAEPKAKP